MVHSCSGSRHALASLLFLLPGLAPGCGEGDTLPASRSGLSETISLDSYSPRIDLLLMIDNSVSMVDKQKALAAVPDLVNRLLNPPCVTTNESGQIVPAPTQPASVADVCPPGSVREFRAIKDIHIGVVTSSLGAHGSDHCVRVEPGDPDQDPRTKNFTQDDRGRLITRGPRSDPNALDFSPVDTYQNLGFLAWDPEKKLTPPGETSGAALVDSAVALVRGADQIGCGYESSLEAWYRFLIDPSPPASIKPGALPSASAIVEGVDEVLLKQRADFLRPDSLVAVINLSDENDCSIIDGQLPATVCDDPELDDAGNPTGVCRVARAGWPRGYAEGNFQGWQADAQGRVTGTPFPVNHLAAQQKVGGGTFRLKSGKLACADDPYSPACSTCYPDSSSECTQLDGTTDAPNLRCWDQKRRFGVDMLYPLRRYVDGLSQQKVYDRNGNLVQNPLFDDLPFKAAKKAGSPLKRPKLEARDPRLVFFATIVGVPWQDIARDPTDLTKGYKPAQPTAEGAESVSWDLILGAPFAIDKAERKDPTDPLMIETHEPRSGVHPITKEKIGGIGTWNRINGHERAAGARSSEWPESVSELQYACVFDLPATDQKDCSSTSYGCDCTSTTNEDPLCEPPGPDGKGTGQSTTTQYRGKAFPGTRFLQVAKDFGQNSIVASICTPNLTNPAAADFGYRPAVVAITDRLKAVALGAGLAGRCLPRPLALAPDGSVSCLVVEGRFRNDPSTPVDEGVLASCQSCQRPGRKRLDPAMAAKLSGVALDHQCLCEVTQLAGSDLAECQTRPGLLAPSSGAEGWCYVDPASMPSQTEAHDAATEIVGRCPPSEKRALRFLPAPREGSYFIWCEGT